MEELENHPGYLALMDLPRYPSLPEVVKLYKEVGTEGASVQVFWNFFDYVQSDWRERKNVESVLSWY